MKKLLLILALFPIFLFAQEQVTYWDDFNVGWWTTTFDQSLKIKERGVYDSTVSIDLKLNADPYCSTWPLIISNNSNEPITIKWMKSQIMGSRIVLGEMSMMTLNSTIPDDIIYPGSTLIKNVTTVDMAKNELIRPFHLKKLKKKYKKEKSPQKDFARVVLCIEKKDGEKSYGFFLNGVYNGKR